MKLNSCICMLLLATMVSAFDLPGTWDMNNLQDTALLLKVKNSILTECVSGFPVTVIGGKVSTDPQMGEILTVDGTGTSQISLSYKGNTDILKGKGMTLEAWVRSNEDLKGEMLYMNGLGKFSFNKNCFVADWIDLPRQKNYVEPEMRGKRLNYYPTGISMTGHLPLRKGTWNHIALVYDEQRKIFRSWINGGIDREHELMRSGQQFLSIPNGKQIRFFYKMKNIQIAGLRIRAGVHNPGQAPLMNHYLNQLPWQKKMILTLDKIDQSVAFPLEVTAILENTSFVYTRTFTDRAESLHMEIPYPRLWPSIRQLHFKVYSQGREIYKGMERYCNKTVSSSGPVQINSDKSLSYQGRKIFPVIVYGVFAEDLEMVAEMGFTTATPRDWDSFFYMVPARDIKMTQKWVKEAVRQKMFLHFQPNSTEVNCSEYIRIYKDLPRMLFWYGADEPWRDWEGLADTYNYCRIAGENFPVMSVQCSEMNMKNTAAVCDILACDPYPIPGVSLRSVACMTKYARNASFNTKPVWTILDCYSWKVPNLQELRCMGVLAIAAGTNGMGIYAWDERSKKKMDKWHTRKHPEIVAMLKTFMSDIRSTEKILVEANLPADLLQGVQQPAIHASLKRAEGKTYLFLANDQRCPEQAVLTLPDASFTQALPLKAFGATTALTFTGGKCSTLLPPLAAGLYELK